MKIAQVSPLVESVPPRRYGGTERIVHYLTEELVRRGHEVTLFASGDSVTSAELRAVWPHALRASRVNDSLAAHFVLLEQVFREIDRFDIVHFHTDYLHFPFSRRSSAPSISTLHGCQSNPDLPALYREYSDMPLVSISDSQRRPIPHATWVATVYHGLPRSLYRFQPNPTGGYLAFLGRLSPEKGVEDAIAIARRVDVPLKIAAKIDPLSKAYYARLQPQLSQPGVEYLGEIDDAHKDEFLGNALALLFPIEWEEPFGLVMIEALACGTPVIAYPRGAVPEILEHGTTGWIVHNREQAAAAVERLGELDRRACRKAFEERFSVERMVSDYLRCYDAVRNRRSAAPLLHSEERQWPVHKSQP